MFTVKRDGRTEVEAQGTPTKYELERKWSVSIGDDGEINICEAITSDYYGHSTHLSVPTSDWELLMLLVEAAKTERAATDKALATCESS